MWCLVLRLSSVIHALCCSWSKGSIVCVCVCLCLCNGFTSFHTGFTSLSIDFVFFFSSEIKVKSSFVNLHFFPCDLTQNTSVFPPLDPDTHASSNSIIHLDWLDPLRDLSFFLNWLRCACFVCRGMFVFLAVCSFSFNREQGEKKRTQKVPHLWTMMMVMTAVQRKQLRATRADCQDHRNPVCYWFKAVAVRTLPWILTYALPLIVIFFILSELRCTHWPSCRSEHGSYWAVCYLGNAGTCWRICLGCS